MTVCASTLLKGKKDTTDTRETPRHASRVATRSTAAVSRLLRALRPANLPLDLLARPPRRVDGPRLRVAAGARLLYHLRHPLLAVVVGVLAVGKGVGEVAARSVSCDSPTGLATRTR